MRDAMQPEVVHIPDCPNLPPMLERLAEVTDLPVTTRVIDSDADAVRFGMAGSPTLLIDGVDPFTVAGGCECGVSCRLYRDLDGRIVSAPSIEQLRDALTAAERRLPALPGEVLSEWRTRAVPLDPVEKAAQQAILRAFATTGHPPAAADLDVVTAGSGRSTSEVLNALHPFSATPTRHRVRIGDRVGNPGTAVDVYAMCAIDALGMARMLGQDTLIESVDATTAQSVTVIMREGRTSWDPLGAVVSVGADADGGPAAACCCDYLNFFTHHAAAEVWTSAHPRVPGQILDQTEAEGLGARLFGHLLATS